ncbi:Uncharacterised protein [Vibrio cholerae]|nr:Uncharacterised protein [Vibrio cholerae]
MRGNTDRIAFLINSTFNRLILKIGRDNFRNVLWRKFAVFITQVLTQLTEQ